jgi:CoA:oxalate CoA-transferase
VVLDLTTALAGPYATMLLAGLGARVIKIENRATDGDASRNNSPYMTGDGLKQSRGCAEDMSVSHLARNRNKESVTLDLKSSRGREVLLDLVREADVLVENFSTGVTDRRLGISYADLELIQPHLVYTSISGFGSDSADGRAMDTIIQALSGVMLTAGELDGPPVRFGLPIADLIAPVFAVIGTLAAVIQQRASGEGQHVDVSMLGALTSLIAAEPYDALNELDLATRTGQHVPRLAPFGTFKAQDGFFALCAPVDRLAHRVFQAMEQPFLSKDLRFATRDARVINADSLHALIADWAREKTLSEVLTRFDESDVPAAPVREPAEALRDPRVRRRREVVPLLLPDGSTSPTISGPGIPFILSKAATDLGLPAPRLGERTAEVLRNLLGYPQELVDELDQAGVL